MPQAAEAAVRARAAAIGFAGEAADTLVGRLSGGEKARLLLGLATLDGPHLLVLDEPTNHLDIDARRALINAMNSYPGAIVLITHDRYLLQASVDRLLLVADGTVAVFDGDLDLYRAGVLSRERRGSGLQRGPATRPSRQIQRRAALKRRTELAPLKRRIDAAEAAIASLHADIARLDAELSRPELFALDQAKATAVAKARAAAVRELAAAEEEWLTASAAYDAAG